MHLIYAEGYIVNLIIRWCARRFCKYACQGARNNNNVAYPKPQFPTWVSLTARTLHTDAISTILHICIWKSLPSSFFSKKKREAFSCLSEMMWLSQIHTDVPRDRKCAGCSNTCAAWDASHINVQRETRITLTCNVHCTIARTAVGALIKAIRGKRWLCGR